mmetsp:Transcript_60554/g.175347  ORF Transcript_60554/g.175347 Transcript_60554/m.175347 type:complete len:625 (-) Transcript_60554:809-2683(-)
MDFEGVLHLLLLGLLALPPDLEGVGVLPGRLGQLAGHELVRDGVGIQVDAVQADGLRHAALEGHLVDGAEVAEHLGAGEARQRLGHEDGHLVVTGRRLQAAGQLHVRGQVRGVDLEVGADGALDGPTVVQAEAHGHAVVRDPREKGRVLAVVLQYRGLVDRGEDLYERGDAHVDHLCADLLRGLLAHAPHDEEGLADVPVRGPVPGVDGAVYDLRQLVHEDHDLVLQDLGRVREVPDVAEAENGVDPAARDHGVDRRRVFAHVLDDDLRPSLAESEGEQLPQLDDGVLQDLGLHRLLLDRLRPTAAALGQPAPCLVPARVSRQQRPALAHSLALLVQGALAVRLVAELHGVERVVPDLLHQRDHALDGLEHEDVRVPAKDHGAECEDEADEQGLQDAVDGRSERVGPRVEHEDHGPLLANRQQLRLDPCLLLNAEVLRALDLLLGRDRQPRVVLQALYGVADGGAPSIQALGQVRPHGACQGRVHEKEVHVLLEGLLREAPEVHPRVRAGVEADPCQAELATAVERFLEAGHAIPVVIQMVLADVHRQLLFEVAASEVGAGVVARRRVLQRCRARQTLLEDGGHNVGAVLGRGRDLPEPSLDADDWQHDQHRQDEHDDLLRRHL